MSERLAMAGAMIAAIAAAVVVYVVMIGLTRAVTMEDMALIRTGKSSAHPASARAPTRRRAVLPAGSTRRSASRGGAHLKKKDR